MSFTENYQNFLKKINERIPIKVIIGNLDKKNPLTSFYIFIIFIIIVLLLIINPFSLNLKSTPDYNTVEFKLADDNGTILNNFDFIIKNLDSDDIQEYSTDNTGKIKIDLDIANEYEFIVEKKGYKSKIQNIDPNENEYKIILEVFNLPTSTIRTLHFIDGTTGQIINEKVSVTIRCENTDYTISPETSDSNGFYEISVPLDCGNLVASAHSANYSATSLIISENSNTVELNENTIPLEFGNVRIIIKSGTNYLDGIKVMIFSSDDLINPVATKDTVFGSVRFSDLAVGDYKAVTNDSQGRYSSSELEFSIKKNKSSTENLNVVALEGMENTGDVNSNVETRTINVLLKDLDTGREISDPLLNPIIILIKDDNQTVDLKSYVQGGISFNVEVNSDYSITAQVEGYINNSKEVISGFSDFSLFVDQITEDNVSDLTIQIIDEDQLVVSNSSVWIYDSDCKYQDPRFAPKLSDSNGSVIFSEIPVGSYCVKTVKGPISGTSENFEIFPPDDLNITVNVFIGTGNINLQTKNKFEDIISNATVEVYNEFNDLLGSDTTNNSGFFSKSIKADKKVYLKIIKDGYLDYYTNLITIYTNKTISKDIILENSINSNIPIIELIGLYDEDNQKVDFVSQNKTYTFKFKLISNQDDFGFKFNIGSTDFVEDDVVYIKDIIENFETITYFTNSDFSGIVNSGVPSNAIDLYWNNVDPAVYELEIPIKIKSATIGQAVPIRYWSYITSNNVGQEVQDIYYVDTQSLCGEDFCVSGQYYDEVEDLVYDIDQGPITFIINNPYRLDYKITNASSTIFNNSKLSLKNKDSDSLNDNALDFIYYNIEQILNNSAQTNKFFASNGYATGLGGSVHHYNIPFTEDYLVSDKLNVYDDIEFSLRILPLSYGPTNINHKIISEQSIVYDSDLETIVTMESSDMFVSYYPENIIPNTPFDFEISIVDDSSMPLEQVYVNVYSISNGIINTISSGLTTNSNGICNINVPALNNNEILRIEVSKAGYYSDPIEIEVNEDLIDVYYEDLKVNTNNPLEINVHKNDFTGTIETIILKNNTDYELELNTFLDNYLSFNYKEYLNLDSTVSNLNSQVNSGFVIPANSEKELNIKLVPSEFVTTLNEALEINGSITLSISRVNSNLEYFVNVPIESLLSIGNGVYEDNCLVIQSITGTWSANVTPGKSQNISFDIINNCRSSENPDQSISLKNIKAKIIQEEDRYGYYDLTIDNITKRLSEGAYKEIITNIDPDPKIYRANIIYTPANTQSGNIKTKIYINAQVESDSGLEYVNTTNELVMETNFTIMDLSDCIDFYDGSREINNMLVIGEDVAELTGSKELIIKNKCSQRSKIKVTFCDRSYTGCTELRDLGFGNMTGVNHNEIEFDIGDTEQIVDVPKPEIPGAYTIIATIESINNNNRVITSTEKRLKVNIKDRLYMKNPFIEIVQLEDGSYQSSQETIYNSDLNYTPWSYATQKIENHPGFSKYIKDDPDFNNTSYKLINFQKFEDLKNTRQKDLGFLNSVGVGITSGLGVVGVTAIAALLKSVALNTVFYGTLGGPAVWVAIVTSIIVGSIANSFSNDYSWDVDYKVADVDMKYTLPELITTKVIDIKDDSLSEKLINVFDITGARYITYLEAYGHTGKDDKLKSDKTMKMTIPKCNGLEHKYLLDNYEYIKKSKNCSDSFNTIDIKDDQIIYKTKCYGDLPRNKIWLKESAYTACAYDSEIWEEQAGYKPLLFNFDVGTPANDLLDQGNNMYKIIQFYPTLNDNDEEVDPAFIDSVPINEDGKFRFEFHIKEFNEIVDPDLNFIDCYTDTGVLGKTGPGAVPKVKFDWDWSPNIDSVVDCSEYYCDATQLTQNVLNRINTAKNLISSQDVVCPKSTSQVLDELMGGRYSYWASNDGFEAEIPAMKTGINSVSLDTDSNQFIVRVNVQNRTVTNQNGLLYIDLDGIVPSAVYRYACNNTYECDTPEAWEWLEETYNPNGQNIMVPFGEDDSISVKYVFGNINDPIIQDNLQLNIDYSGDYLDLENASFTSDINLSLYESTGYQDCEVPATTIQFNGTDYLDLWFNDEAYPNNVQLAWSQDKISELKDTLEFEAYLITDKYNASFIDAFDKAYSGYATIQEGGTGNTESFFTNPVYSEQDILSPLLKYNTHFVEKYSSDEEVDILTPGLYKVRIDLSFTNNDWEFKNNANELEVSSIITFQKISSPEDNSAFYRLPFDGSLGLDYIHNKYQRNGYGLAYLGDEIKLYEDELFTITTGDDLGSMPYKFLNINKEDDLYKLNSNVDTRGKVLIINNNNVNEIQMTIAPSVATPVLLNINRGINRPFSVYYQLKNLETNEIEVANNYLTYWNGVGNYLDFSGEEVFSRFQNYYDRVTNNDDPINQSYALDWVSVSRIGQVNLRTIFYTPLNNDNIPIQYKLYRKNSGNDSSILFYNTNKLDSSVILGKANNDFKISKLKDLFDLIKNKSICVTNSEDGSGSEFWWNPAMIYSTDDVYLGNFSNLDISGISN